MNSNALVQQNYPFVTAFQALLQKLSTLNEQQTSATSDNAKRKITGFKKEQNQVENPKQLAEIVRKKVILTL